MHPSVDMVYHVSSEGGKDGEVWSLPVGSHFPLDLTFQPFVEEQG